MRIKILIAFIIAIILFSCKNQSNINHSQITKDSLLKKYLVICNANPYFDASEMSLYFLKAYNSNDTDALKHIIGISKDISKDKKVAKYDSCLHLKDLKELSVEEAYRFSYWQAFCDNFFDITISKKDSIIKLHYLCFQGNDIDNKKSCVIKNESEKTLSIIDWEKFKKTLDHSDFWALKQENNVWGYDGNGVTVTGFIKGDTNRSCNKVDKYHLVYRWWVDGTDIVNPLNEVLKLSRNKIGCPQ